MSDTIDVEAMRKMLNQTLDRVDRSMDIEEVTASVLLCILSTLVEIKYKLEHR